MTSVTLNRSVIAAVPANEQCLLWDTELSGFGYGQRWSNKRGQFLKRYFVQYKHGLKQRKITFNASKLTFSAARDEARRIFAQVELGIDPQAVLEARRIEQARPTFAAAVQKYLDDQKSKLRPKTLKETERYLTDSYFAGLHRKPLHLVTRDDIAPAVVRIADQSGGPTASRARSTLSSFFAWSITQGLCSENPVIKTAEPEGSKARERVLSDAELRAIWLACDDGSEYGKIARLLLLTGCRRQEIGSMRWSEIDLVAGTFSIPAERSKNGRAHILPLSDMALEVIRSVERRGDRDHLFGERADGFRIWGHAKKKLDAMLGAMEAWTVHDLRRTCATGLGELDVEPWIVEAILNHVSGKTAVAQTYNRAKNLGSLRRALSMWSDHVAGIVSGNQKVVPLKVA